MSSQARRTAALRITTSQQTTELTFSGAVFDCDGLLVDSESIWLRMLTEWIAEQNAAEQISPQLFLGLSVGDTAQQLGARTQADPSAEEIAEELTSRYSTLLADGVALMPGAWDLVTPLTDRVPVAVASNGLRGDVTRMLSSAHLLPAAHTVCTVEDVQAAKPAPDLYLTACHRLSIEPRSAVAFEDSPAGARAAMDAGLTVVGVNSDAGVDLPAHYRLNDLTQVSLCDSAATDLPHTP